MFGHRASRRARPGKSLSHSAEQLRRKKMRRSLSFELLDERAVMSALPLASAFELEIEPAETAPLAQESDAALAAAMVDQASDEPIAQPLVANASPQGRDKTVLMSGLSYTIIASDFGFSDPGNDPPHQLLAVRVTTLPQRGALTLNNVPVTAGQFIPVADIVAGLLKFTTTGSEQFAWATFTFQVQDNGGTAEGGSDIDLSPKTFTFIFDTPQTNYVLGLYQDVLGRTPETAGFIAWLNQLGSGATNQQVADAIWNTPEHRGRQVDGFYQRFFLRQPDAPGRQFWTVQMVSGMTEEAVMAALLTTAEYNFLHSANQQFVNSIYQNVLNRASDTNGRNFWTNALNNGTMTRLQVVTNLINSNEHHTLVVRGYYQTYLRRQPDTQGLLFWVTMLDQRFLTQGQVATRLLATPEYYNLNHL